MATSRKLCRSKLILRNLLNLGPLIRSILSIMETLQFDLYENMSDPERLRQGEVKSYAAKPDGSMIYESRKSDHSVTVERLLWIDGWEQSIENEEGLTPKQEMTLVVLKIVVTSHDPETRFGHVKATIMFEDPSPHGSENEPKVEAWAPFHDEERWNFTTADIKKTTRTEGSANLGYNSSQISGGRVKEGEVTWVQQDFDAGRSNPEPSSRTGHRNGVSWAVEQNATQSRGVTQQIWTAVLLSRRTRSPYLVKFQIDVRAGTVKEFVNKTRRIFGMPPGTTKPFLVTPWESDICNYEGHDIIKSVDRNNLGKLRHLVDTANLNVRWGPKYETKTQPASPDAERDARSLPAAQASELRVDHGLKLEDLPGGNTGREDIAPMPTHPSVSTTAAAAPTAVHSSSQPHTTTLSPVAGSHVPAPAGASGCPGMFIGWHHVPHPSLPPNLDSGRLAALESRVAQTEARLASQEATIMQLREVLFAKTSHSAGP